MEHNFTWKNDGRTKVMIGCGTRPEIDPAGCRHQALPGIF